MAHRSDVWGGPVMKRFKGGVSQSRCTVSGCTEKVVELGTMLEEASDVLPTELKGVRAVDVDGKLLVVWDAGERGGLRLRIAAIDQLKDERDIVLFDDHVKDGALRDESTLVGFELAAVPGGAVLFLGTVTGVYAFFIDGSGKYTPITTKSG